MAGHFNLNGSTIPGVGDPQILGADGLPYRRNQIPSGAANPASGIALPGAWTFMARYSGASNTFWHDRFDEALRHARQDAEAMRNDCWLMAMLRERKEAVSGLNWHLEVPDDDDPEQIRVKDGMTRLVKGIPRLRQMFSWLLEALWYGKFAVQVAWDKCEFSDRPAEEEEGPPPDAKPQAGPGMMPMPGSPPGQPLQQGRYRRAPYQYQGMPGMPPGMPPPGPPKKKGKPKGKMRKGLSVCKMEPLNGDKIGHQQDGTPYILIDASTSDQLPKSSIISTTQNLALSLRGTWRERFIIHSHEREDRDYWQGEQGEAIHGVGIRSRIFWLNWLKMEWLGNISDFFARVGLGLTIWYYQQGNNQALEAIQKAAREQSNRAHLFVPRSPDSGKDVGTGVERVEVPTSGATALKELIQYVDTQIERYIIGQEGSSSASSESGHSNHASSEFMRNTKEKIAIHDAYNLAETLTGSLEEPGLLSVIQAYTFPKAKFPVKWVFDTDSEESQEKLQAIKTLVDMQVKVRADDARKAAGVGKPASGDEVIEPPAPPGGAPPGAGAPPGGDPMAALMGGAGGTSGGPEEGGAEVPPDTGDFMESLKGGSPEEEPEEPEQPEQEARSAGDFMGSLKHTRQVRQYARHDHATTHFRLPLAVSRSVLALRDRIKPDDLSEDDWDNTPHITLVHGLHNDSPDELASLLASCCPVPVELGPISVFDGEDNPADVVKIEVHGPALHALRRTLASRLPHSETHPSYSPHVTLGYVKKGLGHKYAGEHPLMGKQVMLDDLVFSDRDRRQTPIKLKAPEVVEEQAQEETHDLGGPEFARVQAAVQHLREKGRDDLALAVLEAHGRQYKRVPEGTAGAEERKDSLGRKYFDLPKDKAAENKGVVSKKQSLVSEVSGAKPHTVATSRGKKSTPEDVDSLVKDIQGGKLKNADEIASALMKLTVPQIQSIKKTLKGKKTESPAGPKKQEPDKKPVAQPKEKPRPPHKKVEVAGEALSLWNGIQQGIEDLRAGKKKDKYDDAFNRAHEAVSNTGDTDIIESVIRTLGGNQDNYNHVQEIGNLIDKAVQEPNWKRSPAPMSIIKAESPEEQIDLDIATSSLVDPNDLLQDGALPENYVRQMSAHAIARLRDGQAEMMTAMPEDQQEAVSRYTSFGYKRINQALYQGIESLDEDDREDVQQSIDAIDKAMKHGKLKKPEMVWRGISFPNDEEHKSFMERMQSSLDTGGEVQMAGYQSTTVNPAVGASYAGSGPTAVAFEIKASHGLYVTPISKIAHEEELLLPRNAKFRVVGIKDVPVEGTTRKGGAYKQTKKMVQLEQVS
jgi:2'-5' RNA ligase